MSSTSIPLTHDAATWDWPLQGHDGIVKVIDGKDKFEVVLEAQYFKPEEIDVKVAGDEVIIHCKHEKRDSEGGHVAREILRAYHLPKDIDATSIKSYLAHGRLLITANKKN